MKETAPRAATIGLSRQAEGNVLLHDAGRQDVEQHVGRLNRLFAVAVAEAPRIDVILLPLEADLVRRHVVPAETSAGRTAQAVLDVSPAERAVPGTR